MDVKEILTTVSNISIGLDEPSPSDIPVFLRYLNMAYYEVLSTTALVNPIIPKTREVLDCTDGVIDTPSEPVLSIRAVYVPARRIAPLMRTHLDEILKTDPEVSKDSNGNPSHWYYDSGNINVYPLYTGEIGVLYVPTPDRLTINSTSQNIYIPDLFQPILVDGTAYWLFQSESGFKNEAKMLESKSRWQSGQTKLKSYMISLSGKQNFSTYSAV